MYQFFGENEWRNFLSDPQVLADLEESIILKFNQEVSSSDKFDRGVPSFESDYQNFHYQASINNVYTQATWETSYPGSPYSYSISSQESCENCHMASLSNNIETVLHTHMDSKNNFNSQGNYNRQRTISSSSCDKMASCSSISSSSYDSEHFESEHDEVYENSDDEHEINLDDINYMIPKSQRGRKSKDDELLEQCGLYKYFSAIEFVTMSLKQVRQILNGPTLSQIQKQVIMKVRRRGRNKIAARKCRHRRMVHTMEPNNLFLQ
uniref:BZIP domain-containing protein n=1 Tax=Acrobeloides nanus TaxID=290746 RepID=A0A914DFP1_9BILA